MDTYNEAPKSVAIFCTTLEIGQDPFVSHYYWEAYQDLLLALKARGVSAYFATGKSGYLGNGWFSTAYTTDTKLADPKALTQVHNVRVDAIFDRAKDDPFGEPDATFFNPAHLRAVASNKIATFRHFGQFQPKSWIANSAAELQDAVAAAPGNQVVVKEPTGSGGSAVYLGGKAGVLSHTPHNRFPLLVQEFLDTSVGVPGHAPAVHDVRAGICGGEIISYYIRVAKPGSLHSNVSKGGKMDFLAVNTVPTGITEVVRQIDANFAGQPRYYSIDFVYSERGWKMIELNNYPALLPASDHPEAAQTLNKLADYLVAVCRHTSPRQLQAANH